MTRSTWEERMEALLGRMEAVAARLEAGPIGGTSTSPVDPVEPHWEKEIQKITDARYRDKQGEQLEDA